VYLKRLELTGFKSFASRTVFDFGQGMTSIVGPNGSGKSNIADAMRWVLGEGSSKLIRAKKLDDVIYAGSGKRPRENKAEVALVLDNSSKWLPIEAEEVTISRKGTRGGDSDYYLNGRRAKLRDIQTILASASVSQNSYAIIGQGLVESILNLRAEDRRQLIEEAADIQRYRYRIEEAEHRLAQTGENVERVQLLVKEITPRMNQLEKQARKANEYATLSVQLQAALKEFYAQRWEIAQEALTVAGASHDQAQAEFVQARVALETVQREHDDITKRLEEVRVKSAAATKDRDRLDSKLREIERSLAVATERRSILQARQAELTEELAAIEGERERAKAVLATGDSERKRLEAEVAKARRALEEKQAEFSKLEAEYRESHVHAADSDAKAKRLQSNAVELKARIRKLRESRDKLDGQIKKHDTHRRSLVHQLAEHLRILRGLRAQDEALIEEVHGASMRRAQLETEVEGLRDSLVVVEANQNQRIAKLEALDTRLRVLADAQAAAQLNPEEEITIEGAVARVYEMLRVPRGLEEAIAAVLGEQLEAFIFDRQGDAMAAIYAHAREGGPRAAAIALDTTKAAYPLSLMKEKGVVGVAAHLVKYPQKYEKLVNTLLGRVIVVQDIETAMKISKRRLGTIVTQDGIVIDTAGLVWGGRQHLSKTLELSYDRDMDLLPKEIARLRHAIEIAEREAHVLRERLRQASGELTGLSGEADSVIARRLKLQDSVASRQQKMAQLRGEIRGVMGSIANVIDQQKTFDAQALQLEGEVKQVETLSLEAGDTAKHLANADKMFAERRTKLQKLLDEAADALAKADAGQRSVAVQEENSKAILARVEAQASAKAVQLRGLEMELSTLSNTIAGEEKEAASVRGELEKLMEFISPGQEGTHHLEARQADVHKQVVGAQSRMFEAERRTLESEAEVRKWQTEVDNLRQRMAEDGLVLEADGSVKPEKQTNGHAPELEVPGWMLDDGGAGGLRPISGAAGVDHEALAKEIDKLRAQIRALGPVNVEAQADYEELRERHDFLTGQLRDLGGAEESLQRAIQELTNLMKKKFETTFVEVATNFEQNFSTFFGGGHAKLKLSDPKHTETSGVEIEARPPGKRTSSLTQLSGGEKSLTAVSLLFALLQVNPSPFCVLDEVDAMLDEANVGRFATAIKEQSKLTQFVVITHNRRTIEQADSIYGISMGPDAVSRVLSMRLGDVTLPTQSQN
jgi:chromosome segregation protein